MRRLAVTLSAIGLAGCGGGGEDRSQNVDPASPAVKQADDRGRIPCAPPGEGEFRTVCTIDRSTDASGVILTARLPDGGFHRFRVSPDGRGVIAADGVEPARVTMAGDRTIEVEIGGARYRLPATR